MSTTGTVLIAEDDAGIRRMLCAALSGAGYATVEVSRGDHVLESLLTLRVDAVLLDLQLPGRDGRDVLRALKADPSLSMVPVLMITGDATPDTLVQSLREGADDFIRKPFDLFELLARVEAAIEQAGRLRTLSRAALEMEHLALTDALTGLENRRAAERHLTRMLSHSRRTGEDLGVLLVDIDHFKDCNDAHGHAAGDTVLVQVAARLERMARSGDVVARWGGEEFIVLLPGSDTTQAHTAAERLRSSVSLSPVPFPGSAEGLPVTVSIGVAAGSHATLDTLVAAADAALYEAKRMGRDRVAAAAVRAADASRLGLVRSADGHRSATGLDEVG